MPNLKKFAITEDMDWQDEEEELQERSRRIVRVRRREAPMSPRVTRKMDRVDAELLMRAAGLGGRASLAPTAPPPRRPSRAPASRRAMPPPLPIAFPFPFANAANPLTVTTTAEDFLEVHDSWLAPPPEAPAVGRGRQSLVPREPDPFTIRPPTYSILPR